MRSSTPWSICTITITRTTRCSRRDPDSPMTLRGADILWSCLAEQGVDTVFGNPGGMLPACDRLLDHPIRHVLVRHEQSATHMAHGYARVSGRVGVAVATSGPGATNLVTGIATAMMDSIPVVCFTGQVPALLPGSDAFQETDSSGATRPITKHNYLVQRAEDIPSIVREAFRVATEGRPGPVLVGLTRNAQQEQAEWTSRDPDRVGARVWSERDERLPEERIASGAGGPAVRDLAGIDGTGPLQAAQVIRDLWRATGGRAVVVTDVGQHQAWAAQCYPDSEPHAWITAGGLGSMGFALPAAIGAKLARPDAEVWAVVGDGGFQMTQAELATLVQEGIKVNIAIINTGVPGMVRQWQPIPHDRRYSATPLSSPDFVKIADAHGLPGVHVSTGDQALAAIRHARASAGPVLIDFHVVLEDAVDPMAVPGPALNELIHSPRSALAESGADRP